LKLKFQTFISNIKYLSKILQVTASMVWWSEFLRTDPEARVRFPELPDFLSSSGSGKGPLSLVSTIEELLEIKSSGSSLENRDYGRRDSSS
jgi:hypothetical protein